MADDRHEAYRMMFSTGELKEFFEELSYKYTTGLLAYLLIQATKENPEATVNRIIDIVRKRLNESGRS